MVDPTFNDNDVSGVNGHWVGADAHGHAALLLVESLIHALLARSVISVEDAVEIVAVAAEVKEAIQDEAGASPATTERSLRILREIRASLAIDLPEDLSPFN
ncbi:hypothetical protein WG907_11080 [Sphingobium sp. AN558]|uniref:hypothetical protein n=1 Tax=Sphingobium sp. AN558 TaxID=3133442 RepID=UPI0030BFBA4A